MYAVGRLRLAIVYALGMFVLLYGCSSSDETGETGGGATAASTTATLAFLQRPFRGSSLNSAPFDHDLPLAFKGDDNGYMLTWWGGRINGIWSGHHGHDWLLPAGTPVLAAADGEVVYADFEPPFQCGSRGEVRALVVRLRHVAPNGETSTANTST